MTTHAAQAAAALRLLHEQEWERQAACPRYDAELWFRDDTTSQHKARTVCVNHCPVRGQCLAYGLLSELGQYRRHRAGMYGGMTDIERWNCDPTAKDRTPLDGPRPNGLASCGLYSKFLHHLLHGQPVDRTCWSAEKVRHQARLRAENRRTDEEEVLA